MATKPKITADYKFIKYISLYDPDLIFYALDKDPVKKDIDGVMFIEATTNFSSVMMIRMDSLKVAGHTYRTY